MREIDRVGRERGGELDGCVGGLGRDLRVLVPALAVRPVRGPLAARRLGVVDAVRVVACVEIKILRRVRPESARRPPRHRCDACSMAWRCRFLTVRLSQDGRVIAEK